MTAPDMRSLIDELGAQAMECRQLLADVRTATKDLRRAVREARDARDELGEAIKEMVGADIDAAVKSGLEKYDVTLRAAMDAGIKKVGDEFDKLGNLFLTGDTRGRAPDGFDLRNFAKRGEL